MTYQGARARPEESEVKRIFTVSRVMFSGTGHVTHVLWTEVDGKSDRDVGPGILVPVADVVDAIHDGARVTALFPNWPSHFPQRQFEVVEHPDGFESVALVKPLNPSSNTPELRDLEMR